MSGWEAKRFWREVAIEPVSDGWTLRLDARPVRTPAKHSFVMPTAEMAEAAAAEWAAQTDRIRPLTMPVTRSVNAAIDKVAPERDGVVRMIAAYGATDLLCYRAEGPEALRARQDAGWEPLLAWAETTFGARLDATEGVMPRRQPSEALARLEQAVASETDFELTALSDLVSLTGSLVLGLAVARGRLSPGEAWALSRVDEEWQIAGWGEDAEAAEAAARRAEALAHAGRFHRLARGFGEDAIGR